MILKWRSKETERSFISMARTTTVDPNTQVDRMHGIPNHPNPTCHMAAAHAPPDEASVKATAIHDAPHADEASVEEKLVAASLTPVERR